MATRRTYIAEALVEDIYTKTSVLQGNVQRQMIFLNEVNDFPFVTFLPREELRTHRGDGRKFATLNISLRAYVFNGNPGGESIADAEDLAIDIEQLVIDTFAASHRDMGVEEARVRNFTTDEGLLAPYGIADLEIAILYDLDIPYSPAGEKALTVDTTLVRADTTLISADATRS